MNKKTVTIRMTEDEIAALWNIMAKWQKEMDRPGSKSEMISILIHNEFFNIYGSTIEECYSLADDEEEGL